MHRINMESVSLSDAGWGVSCYWKLHSPMHVDPRTTQEEKVKYSMEMLLQASSGRAHQNMSPLELSYPNTEGPE